MSKIDIEDLNIGYYLHDTKNKVSYDEFKIWFINYVTYLARQKFSFLSIKYVELDVNCIIAEKEEDKSIEKIYNTNGISIVIENDDLLKLYNGDTSVLLNIYEQIYNIMDNFNYSHGYIINKDFFTYIKDRIILLYCEDDEYFENNEIIFPDLVMEKICSISSYLEDAEKYDLDITNKEDLQRKYNELLKRYNILINSNKRNYLGNNIDLDKIIINFLNHNRRTVLTTNWFINWFYEKDEKGYKVKECDDIRNYIIENDLISKLSDDLISYYDLREMSRK